jgi:hypothetical protein
MSLSRTAVWHATGEALPDAASDCDSLAGKLALEMRQSWAQGEKLRTEEYL